MEYARVDLGKGYSKSHNWILDEVMDTLNHFGISNEDEKNDELIKRLTVEKIEACRKLIAGVLVRSQDEKLTQHLQEIEDSFQDSLRSLGKEPTRIILVK